MNVGEQISLFDQDGWYSRMSLDYSAPIMEKTSEQFSKKRQELPMVTPQFLDFRTGSPGLILGVFWQTDGLSLGGYIPLWEWLAGRIVGVSQAEENEHPTMASLFDGIGGFPLVFQRTGCEPVWASEIEEFPIAVTKKHFPDREERKE